MRTSYRVLIMAVLFVAFFILLKMRLYDIWDQYNVQAYLSASLGFEVEAHFVPPPLGRAGDKVVVMAKMEEENTDWVGENLFEYVIDLRLLFFLFSFTDMSSILAGSTQSTPSTSHPPACTPLRTKATNQWRT